MIYLLRHGETLWNRGGRLQGQQDSPLTARGVAQARDNGLRLRQCIDDPKTWDIVASPLGRCWQTAVLVAESLDLDPSIIRLEPRLREISYGIWEGQTHQEIAERHPSIWQRRQADPWNYSAPGGESYAALSARSGAWLAGVDPAARLIVVSHGGTGRTLRGHHDGLSPRETLALRSAHDTIHRLDGGHKLGRGKVASLSPTS